MGSTPNAGRLEKNPFEIFEIKTLGKADISIESGGSFYSMDYEGNPVAKLFWEKESGNRWILSLEPINQSETLSAARNEKLRRFHSSTQGMFVKLLLRESAKEQLDKIGPDIFPLSSFRSLISLDSTNVINISKIPIKLSPLQSKNDEFNPITMVFIPGNSQVSMNAIIIKFSDNLESYNGWFDLMQIDFSLDQSNSKNRVNADAVVKTKNLLQHYPWTGDHAFKRFYQSLHETPEKTDMMTKAAIDVTTRERQWLIGKGTDTRKKRVFTVLDSKSIDGKSSLGELFDDWSIREALHRIWQKKKRLMTSVDETPTLAQIEKELPKFKVDFGAELSKIQLIGFTIQRTSDNIEVVPFAVCSQEFWKQNRTDIETEISARLFANWSSLFVK